MVGCCGSAPKPTSSRWNRLLRPRGGGETLTAVGPVGGGLSGQVRDEIGGRVRRRRPTHVPVSRRRLGRHAHVRAILTTITGLAAQRAYEGMDRWLHTLGYRGHITTKSRPFSTTMGALRAYRATWTANNTSSTPHQKRSGKSWATLTIDPVEWEFDRVGLPTLGERALISSAAQRMIEHRHTARETSPPDPPAEREQVT